MPTERSKKAVIRSILERKRKGKKINDKDVKKAHPSLHKAGRAFYSSWGRAIKAAGIDPATVDERGLSRRRWTPQMVIKEIQRLHKLGEPLHSRHVCLNHPRLYGASRVLGGWSEAIAAAGLDYLTIRKRPQKKWTKKNGPARNQKTASAKLAAQ